MEIYEDNYHYDPEEERETLLAAKKGVIAEINQLDDLYIVKMIQKLLNNKAELKNHKLVLLKEIR